MWLCRELGIPFENVPVAFSDPGSQSAAFVAANPSRKIPVIDEDGFCLSESMAINLYLAKKHRSPLLPTELQGEAKVLQWSFWVVSEVEKPLLQAMFQRMKPPADPAVAKYFRDRNPLNPEVERLAIESLQKPLAYLHGHLQGRDYLLGNEFTLADLNVAAVLAWAFAARMDFDAIPNVKPWLSRCLDRPARTA
jgi:glutathione S-transferase